MQPITCLKMNWGGGSWASSDRDGEGGTVLGQARTIPYSVDNIRQAYNNLYSTSIAAIQPNYLYVRFLPQSPTDVKTLLESDLELWDFPLHYDIFSIGETYHDPTVSDSNYTWQYAVVPADFIFPSIQYEIIERLALVPEDSRIAEEAFRITGNEYETPDEYEPDPQMVNGKFQFTLDHSSPPGGESGERGGPCWCLTPDNMRKPSGCVQVFDNMLNQWDGVREVKVIVSKSRLFGIIFHRSDYTDEAGCWYINHKYKGKIHVWVKWESATCNIKTMKSNVDLWNYTFPRRAYIGKYNGPNFNNIAIQFNWTSSINSKTFRNWVASTANNAIYEFQNYAINNSLPHPPGDLKVLITPWGSGNTGAAPMLDKFSIWSQALFVLSANQILKGVFMVAAPVGTVLSLSLSTWLVAAAPDIVLNWNDGGNANSDDIRETMYHELAHAQHFGQVGQGYWLDEILFTVANLGYGDGSAPGSGRAEVVEMWGWQNGRWAAHLRYGLSHSNPGAPATNTWQGRLERGTFASSYIAFGWQYDIQDNNALTPNLDEGEISGVTVPDAVSGYTQAQIFATMTPSMLSANQQRLVLQPTLPPGTTLAAYIALATAYGL